MSLTDAYLNVKQAFHRGGDWCTPPRFWRRDWCLVSVTYLFRRSFRWLL